MKCIYCEESLDNEPTTLRGDYPIHVSCNKLANEEMMEWEKDLGIDDYYVNNIWEKFLMTPKTIGAKMFQKLEKYAFPGRYQVTYLNEDDDTLCPHCAMIEQREATSFVHWEGDPLYCERCSKEIESEYGSVDE